MLYFLGWLSIATLFYFHLYCNGADLNFRYKNRPDLDDGFWKFHRDFYAEGARLWVHDYFRVHCPWNWETAKFHRLAHMRDYLGVEGACHEKLGHITAADCDDPLQQETIARGAFVSRSRFWLSAVGQFVIAPVSLPLMIVLAVIVGVCEILAYAWECVFG